MIYHAFDMMVANYWLTYIKDSDLFAVLQNKRLDLMYFRMKLGFKIDKRWKTRTIKINKRTL